MNFLAHDCVLPAGASPATRVAATLPDLWNHLPKRPLPLHVVRRLDAHPHPLAASVRLGVQSHLRADAVFHRHDLFHDEVRRWGRRLAQAWPSLRHPQLAAHIFFEMLIDRWLLEERPGVLRDYYAHFEPATREAVATLALGDGGPSQALTTLLGRFVSAGFLRDYASADGLVFRFGQVMARVMGADTAVPPAVLELVQIYEGESEETMRTLVGEVTREVAALFS